MLPCSISVVSLDAELNVRVLYWFVLHLYSKDYNKCLLQRYYNALLQRYYKGLYRVITLLLYGKRHGHVSFSATEIPHEG